MNDTALPLSAIVEEPGLATLEQPGTATLESESSNPAHNTQIAREESVERKPQDGGNSQAHLPPLSTPRSAANRDTSSIAEALEIRLQVEATQVQQVAPQAEAVEARPLSQTSALNPSPTHISMEVAPSRTFHLDAAVFEENSADEEPANIPLPPFRYPMPLLGISDIIANFSPQRTEDAAPLVTTSATSVLDPPLKVLDHDAAVSVSAEDPSSSKADPHDSAISPIPPRGEFKLHSKF